MSFKSVYNIEVLTCFSSCLCPLFRFFSLEKNIVRPNRTLLDTIFLISEKKKSPIDFPTIAVFFLMWRSVKLKHIFSGQEFDLSIEINITDIQITKSRYKAHQQRARRERQDKTTLHLWALISFLATRKKSLESNRYRNDNSVYGETQAASTPSRNYPRAKLIADALILEAPINFPIFTGAS